MSLRRRQVVQEATSSAVSWPIAIDDDFDIPLLVVHIDAAPTTAENLTVSLDSVQGAAYDTVLRTYPMLGITDVAVHDLEGFVAGDIVVVAFANTDGNSVTGVATVQT